MARYYDHSQTPALKYQPGDHVYLDASDITTTQPLRKLLHCHLGPFLVERQVVSGDSPFLSSSPAFNISQTSPVTVSTHTPLSALSFGPTPSPQTAPVLCPSRLQVADCHLLPFAFASICLRVFDRSADAISSDLPPGLRSFRDVIRCHLMSFASGF